MLLLLSLLTFSVALVLAWAGLLGGVGGGVALLALGASSVAYLFGRRRLAEGRRRRADAIARLLFTLGGLLALLRHPIDGPGGPAPLHEALVAHLSQVEPATFLLWGGIAMAIKLFGVLCSAMGWHLLLRGQGIALPFGQTVLTGFLIGRFIGTFLPSTLGLDGYTLWEAGRVTRAWPRVVSAKLAEKVVGGAALFGGILLTLPVAHGVFSEAFGSDRAPAVTAGVGLIAASVVLVALALFLSPSIWAGIGAVLGRVMPARLGDFVARASAAATAYRAHRGLLVAALGCKLIGHFTTAVVYWCTALAIGVVGASFLPIVAGSLLQIVGTLLSPTLAGEGAREALQALLLTPYYDANPAKAVLAASLGFIAAEAATLWGGVFLWTRTERWRPTFVRVDGVPVAEVSGEAFSTRAVQRTLGRSAVEDQDPARVEAGAQGERVSGGAGLGDAPLKGKEVPVE
ncbi:MAG: UPF0104 family protein [Deltaproteobacteria bacterium]|nr:MAG: UPF0104 family protein [Deltaproteobacteria bacterium]